METVTYEIPLSALREFVEKVTKDPRGSQTAEAVQFATNHMASEWIKTASGKLKHTTGWYALGVQEGLFYPYMDNPFHGAIIHTDKRATYLERGYKEFDMKKMLFTSPKVRVSKDGNRYLIIPFHHGSPGSLKNPMPEGIYAKASKMTPSMISGIRLEGSQQSGKIFSFTYKDAQLMKRQNPIKVKRNSYNWGDCLGLEDTPENKHLQGMVRFQKNPNLTRQISTGKFINTTHNDRDYSEYITFRVMSEKSMGWIHPGLDPMNILKETVERERPNIVRIISEGVMRDYDQLRKRYTKNVNN
ncbi:MAG TPA: hypothetical protein VHO03_16940 [Ignavibacteriales bacterium]|nr:hypothetical protein [Ignavibacteriales bacterium]